MASFFFFFFFFGLILLFCPSWENTVCQARPVRIMRERDEFWAKSYRRSRIVERRWNTYINILDYAKNMEEEMYLMCLVYTARSQSHMAEVKPTRRDGVLMRNSDLLCSIQKLPSRHFSPYKNKAERDLTSYIVQQL